MKRQHIILFALGLTSVACDSQPACSEGLCIDLTTYNEQIQAVVGGTFTGSVEEAAGVTDDDREACSVAGQTFALTLDAGEVDSCDTDAEDGETGQDDCAEAAVGLFDVEGTLGAGESDQSEVYGFGRIWNSDDGVHLGLELGLVSSAFPMETLDTSDSGSLVEEMTLSRFRWSRRTSDDQADDATWQICELPVEDQSS